MLAAVEEEASAALACLMAGWRERPRRWLSMRGLVVERCASERYWEKSIGTSSSPPSSRGLIAKGPDPAGPGTFLPVAALTVLPGLSGMGDRNPPVEEKLVL